MTKNTTKKEAGAHLTTKSNAALPTSLPVSTANSKILSLRRPPKGLAVHPTILADDEVLDIILAAHCKDHIGMLCESVSKAVCRALVLAADKTGCQADVLYNTSLDLKMRFKRPTADEWENGDAFFAEDE